MSAFNVHVTGRRVVATLIDVVIIGLFSDVVFRLDPDLNEGAASLVVLLVVALLYYTLWEGTTGRTIGKYATGIRVIDEVTGQSPGLGKALIRNLLRILDCQFAYLVGFLIVLASPSRCRTGDKTAHTLVVRV